MEKKARSQSRTTRTAQPRHVLIADDGSAGAARAREFALMLAATAGTQLTVVYVRDPLESIEDGHRKLAGMLAAADAAGLRCKALVEPPIGITSRGRRIVTAGERSRADLIVVGARGAGLVRKLLGSVSTYVVTHARVSVCVVR